MMKDKRKRNKRDGNNEDEEDMEKENDRNGGKGSMRKDETQYNVARRQMMI